MKYLADISFRAGQLGEARDGYRRAIAARFRHPDVFVNLAAIAEREGRLDEARAALADAVQTDATATPTRGTGWGCSRRGVAMSTRRGARSTSAIAAEPGRAEPYYNLGRDRASCRQRSGGADAT